MKIKDNKTKKIFELKHVYYDDNFKRTFYEFHAINYKNLCWNIIVYNNESLEKVLQEYDFTIDN